ncbi:hypothetical protein PSTT_02529 [Puccinia striiformis]|uniref:Uncharacterized protein n=1 Tax=Puccinia striiformis TaxID=27350 RepID=A0A2S4VZH0_9BASI|nr:hypothetical protein PSTT_02529 [Puccinia striiformis]
MYQLIHPSSVVQILADLSGTGPARIKPRASRYGRWGRLKSTVSLSVYFEMEGPMPQARVSISWPGDGLPLLLHPILCTSVMVFFKYFQSLISASPAVDTTRRRVHPQMPFSQLPLGLSQVSTLSASLDFYICSPPPPPQSVVTEHITNISQDQIKNLGITLSTHFVKSNPNIMFVTFFVLATVTLIAFKYLSQNQTNFKQENLMLKKMNEEKDLQLDRVLEDNKQLKADNRKLTKLEKDLERDRVLEDNKQLKADICELTKLEKDLERDRLLEDNKQLKADNRELTKLISAGSLIGQVSETWFTRSIPFLLFSIFLLLLLSFFV